eukprot:Gb_30770 [translate_table: standard]
MEHLGSMTNENLSQPLISDMRPKEQSESDRKVQESLNNFLKRRTQKDPFLSFSRSGENPVQWIHWLDALDQQNLNKFSKGIPVQDFDAKECGQEKNICIDHCSPVSNTRHLQSPTDSMQSLKIPQSLVAFAHSAARANDLPGWPLLAPSKVEMIKCDKCNLEFCSSLNHQRHIRTHRRPLNGEKVTCTSCHLLLVYAPQSFSSDPSPCILQEDLQKERMNLAAFWDKISPDEARQIVSLCNIMLEEVTGASIIKALASFLRRPRPLFLPQNYLKAGDDLLDVVQNKLPTFPLPAEDLFNILDNASERTFLCTDTSVSVQRFVFEGETRKVGLEVQNLVASIGFLVEQKLVKAWIIDRDAEALCLQKQLVEEEVVAQKRQAELLERRRLKKARQKELKEKDCADFSSENSDQLLVDTKYLSSNQDMVAVQEVPEIQKGSHQEYASTDLDHRDSQLSKENPFLHDQGEPDKSLKEDDLQIGRSASDCEFAMDWKQWKSKRSNRQTSLESKKKTHATSKPLSGQQFAKYRYTSLGQSTNPNDIQKVATSGPKKAAKSEKGPQGNKDVVTVRKTLELMQSPLDARANRPTSMGSSKVQDKSRNITIVETGRKKYSQNSKKKSTSHTEKAAKLEERSKDSTDVNTVEYPVEPMQFLSGASNTGPYFDSSPKWEQNDHHTSTRESDSRKDCQSTQQTASLHLEKTANLEERSTENTSDVNTVAKPVKPMQPLCNASSTGPILDDSPKFEEKGMDIAPAETGSSKDNQNSTVAALCTKADKDFGYQSERKSSNVSELLFGSISVCLKNVPGRALVPPLIKDCKYNANSKSPLKSKMHISEDLSYSPCNIEVAATSSDVHVRNEDGNDDTKRQHKETCVAEVDETSYLQESEFMSVCDAAKGFLSRKWEDAIADTEAIVIDIDSGVEDESVDIAAIFISDSESGVKDANSDTEATFALDSDSIVEDAVVGTEVDCRVEVAFAKTEAAVVLNSDSAAKHGIAETQVMSGENPNLSVKDASAQTQAIVDFDPGYIVEDAVADTEAVQLDSDSNAVHAIAETPSISTDPEFGLRVVVAKTKAAVVLDSGSGAKPATAETQISIVPDADLSVKDAVAETQSTFEPGPDFRVDDVAAQIQVTDPDSGVEDKVAEIGAVCGVEDAVADSGVAVKLDSESGMRYALTEAQVISVPDPDLGANYAVAETQSIVEPDFTVTDSVPDTEAVALDSDSGAKHAVIETQSISADPDLDVEAAVAKTESAVELRSDCVKENVIAVSQPISVDPDFGVKETVTETREIVELYTDSKVDDTAAEAQVIDPDSFVEDAVVETEPVTLDSDSGPEYPDLGEKDAVPETQAIVELGLDYGVEDMAAGTQVINPDSGVEDADAEMQVVDPDSGVTGHLPGASAQMYSEETCSSDAKTT